MNKRQYKKNLRYYIWLVESMERFYVSEKGFKVFKKAMRD